MEFGVNQIREGSWLVGYIDDYPEFKSYGKDLAEREDLLYIIYENLRKIKSGKKTICILNTF